MDALQLKLLAAPRTICIIIASLPLDVDALIQLINQHNASVCRTGFVFFFLPVPQPIV